MKSNYHEYDMKGSIILAKQMTTFGNFMQKDMQCVIAASLGTKSKSARMLPNLSEPVNGVGEARLLLHHG